MLSSKTIEEVKSLPILETIEKYVTLKKSGAQYMGKSPFTDEKSGSFSVSVSKNCWKCFSTGIGGNNAISFLMKLKHYSFYEAVKILATENNITIQYDESDRAIANQKVEEKKQTLANINTVAADYFEKNLDQVPEKFARASALMNEKFNLGYAPNEWQGLHDVLIKQGFSTEQMLDAGLVVKGPKGVFDMFRGRVMFPIYDLFGRIIGFSGRSALTFNHRYTDESGKEKTDVYAFRTGLKEIDFNEKKISIEKALLNSKIMLELIESKSELIQKEVKIINSKETEAYSKSNSLLGLFQSKDQLFKSEKALIVEGNYDLTSMHQAGFENTVACLGSAFTSDHVNLLKRFSKKFCFVVDNDAAGLKKIESNTLISLGKGITVSLFIPGENGTDPDDWCKSLKFDRETAFAEFEENEKDAVEFLAEMYFQNSSTTVKFAQAQEKLSALLCCISDAGLRNLYVKKFAKEFQIDKSTVEKSVSILLTEKHGDSDTVEKKFRPKVPLDDDEFEDYKVFGFYPDKRPATLGYYFGDTKVSNWLMRPLFQVRDSRDSKRFIELITGTGKIVVEVPNSKINSPQGFQEIVSNHGGYFFHGNLGQYQRLKAKFLLQFPKCTEIKTLGWNNDGFFAFSNGIIQDGSFKQVDSYGLVSHRDNQYFLPAFSSIYKDASSDDDFYKSDRRLVYRSGGTTFEAWAKKFNRVYKDNENGMFAISFFMATLFSDFIFSKKEIFPILMMYGLPRTGKTTCGRSLSKIFKTDSSPFNLHSGTVTGFQRVLSRVKNIVEHLDEYRNDLDEKRFQNLKGIHDRTGSIKGQMSQDNKTVETEIHASAVITGQHMPTRDGNSLFTRCITLEFSKTLDLFSTAEIKEFNELGEMERKGLSDVIIEVIKFRPLIESKFTDREFEIGSQLRDEFGSEAFDGRVALNFVIVLAVVSILEEVVKLPFKYKDLYNQSKQLIVNQSALILSSDELAEFFQQIEFLSLQHRIVNGNDYSVKSGLIELTIKEGNKSTKVIPVDFKTRVLYIKMANIFPLYSENARKQGLQPLPKTTIESYFKSNKAFLGVIKSHRFGEFGSTSAFAFDYDKLEISLAGIQDLNEKSEEQKTTLENTYSPAIQGALNYEKEDKDLPF